MKNKSGISHEFYTHNKKLLWVCYVKGRSSGTSFNLGVLHSKLMKSSLN